MRLHQAGWSISGLLSTTLLLACTVESSDPTGAAGQPGAAGSSSAGSSNGASTAGAGAGVLPTGGASSSMGGGETGGAASVPLGGAAPAGGQSGGGSAGAAAGGEAAGGMSGGLPSGPTAGCGMPSQDEPNKDILHNIMVGGESRRYWTKLPATYDGTTAFPVVFYGPGCGASSVEGAPLDGSIRDKAIRVFVIGTGSCFSTGGPEPETGYFNAVLDEVQANYCTDKGKVFVSGYSSGGWLSMLLACTAGDRITAIGTAAGGLKASHPACKGNPAAIYHAGTGDTANPIVKLNADGVNEGSSASRDELLMRNGCSMETTTWDPDFPYCKQYMGCKSPVVWCEQNVGHSNGEEVSRSGWWKFWSSLP